MLLALLFFLIRLAAILGAGPAVRHRTFAGILFPYFHSDGKNVLLTHIPCPRVRYVMPYALRIRFQAS